MTTETKNPYVELALRYQNDRPGFVRNVLGAEPDVWQEDILRAMDQGQRRIAVRSGHGVGKSTLAAWAACHAMTCFPSAKVVQTAPSGPQLFDALFSESKMWFGRLPDGLRELFSIQADRIESVAAPEQLFVTARTSRAETPEALQGYHSDGGIVILCVDEASGIPEQVFEAGAGSMSGHNCITLLMSNPTRISGTFFDCFHRLKHMWFTRHVSCYDSRRVAKDFIDDIIARYGEGSNAFRVRVLGEFPIKDDSTYISLELVEAAQRREIALDPKGTRKWGVDPARFGNDRSVLTKRCGTVVKDAPRCWRQLDTMQLAGAVKHEWDNTVLEERPEAINVDVIGLGAGVVDRLREMGLPAVGVNVAESPSLNPNNSYDRLRDELWGLGKAWLEARDCSLPNDEGFMELAMPVYTFKSNGAMKVESKDDFKKRLKFSPDYADSFLLTFAGPESSGGAKGYGSNWAKPIKRMLKGIV